MKLMSQYHRYGALVLLIAGGSLSANATTLFFAGLSTAGNGSNTEGNSVSQSGYTFLDEGGGSGGGSGFSVWQASSPNLPGLNAANTSLFETFALSTTGLTHDGGGAFTILSIDLAQYDCCRPVASFNVTFTGTYANLTTTQQIFSVNQTGGTPQLVTYNFNANFANIVKLEFTQGGGGPTGYQFDNLQVLTPEPATFSLAAVSLVGLYAMRRFLKRA